MLIDLVVDTNVLLHGSNPNEVRFNESRSVLISLLSSTVILCVDEGFSIDSAKNRSQIVAEYLTHLRVGTLGFETVRALATNGRILAVSRAVDYRQSKLTNQWVTDKTDRVFVKVAVNSKEHVLVSHDFTHISPTARAVLEKKIGVRICDCAKCLLLMG